MLRVTSLRKQFGPITAVDGLSFEVARGETFGFLGPNGAGKSTSIAMMVGALAPDSGAVEIAGLGAPTDPAVRRAIGFAPQALALDPELTASEHQHLFARLHGLAGAVLKARVEHGLELAGLADRRHGRASTFSGGMQRRLNLACALVHDPQVVFLDEPTAGVDPQSRNRLFENIGALKAAGKTVLYTTHYMEEAQRLCDRVAIIDHGRVLALDTVPALIRAHGGESTVEADFEAAAPGDQRPLRLKTTTPVETVAALLDRGTRPTTLRVVPPDLEGVFLHLTGRTLRDA